MIEEAKVEAVMIGVATEAGDRVETSKGVAAPALGPCCYARFSAPSVAVLAGFNHVLSFPQNRLSELRPVVRELDQRNRLYPEHRTFPAYNPACSGYGRR